MKSIMDKSCLKAVIVLLASCCLASLEEVCIDSSDEKPHSSCESTTTIDKFCQGASYWHDDIVVRVLSGTHLLTRTCELHHVNNVTLRGLSESKVVIQCSHHEDNGFIFYNVSMLRISDIEFTGCGTKQNSEHNQTPSDLSAALLFVNGSNLTLVKVTVYNSNPAGICVKNVVGTVIVDSCVITNASSDNAYSGNIFEYEPFITENAYLTIVNTQVSKSGLNQEDTDECGMGSSGLFFLLSSSRVTINITNVNLTQNRGCMGGNMYVGLEKSASVTISHTSFNEGHSVYGGGNLAMEFADSASVNVSQCAFKKGYANSGDGGNMYMYFTGSASVTITLCSFNEGYANKGDGGNMAMEFADYALVNMASATILSQCSFKGGYAGSGGNIYIEVHSTASVTISDTSLRDGYADKDGGGGIYVFLNNNGNFLSSELLRIISSTFISNVGEFGGGGLYVGWKKPLSANGTLNISITNSSFDNNSLIHSDGGGAAVCIISTQDSDRSNLVNYVQFNISHCKFFNHLGPASGVIAAIRVPFLAIDSSTIHSNNCSAIAALRSTLMFSGSSQIINNTAMTGAGILLDNSFIFFIKSNMNLLIANNNALGKGGGIRIFGNSGCILTTMLIYDYYACFMYVSPSLDIFGHPLNFTITGNSAQEGGDNIFGDQQRCISTTVHVLHVPPNTLNQPSSISSKPQQVCFNIHSGHKVCDNSTMKSIYPGQNLTIPVYVVGEYLGFVAGTVLADVIEGGAINDTEKVQEIGLSGGKVTYQIYSSSDHTNHARLNLQPVQYGCNHLDTLSKAVVEITFFDCPFGFIYTNSSPGKFECQCNSNPAITSCSITSQTITKRRYSWVGMFELNNHSYLATNDFCPLDYCNSMLDIIQSNPNSLDQDEQCQYNRTGILCGSCPPGWSLVLGSSECRECTSMWLLLILPFALAGLLLVMVIHFLNLTVTMGTVCGLIFYANVIQDYSVILLSTDPIPGLTPILQTFLSWLNLDLGISSCFYDGMEAFGKTMLLFVFPIYIWLISVIIILLSNRYIFFTRLVGENSVKVLSTLFLLAYSKMFRVTLGVLKFKTVNIFRNDSTVISIRWVADGNISYSDPQRHLVLLVIAAVFIVLLLPFSMSLLCIRHVYSLSNCCQVFSWINKLKPFFDTYTGPFKDRARFWTGLLLFVRLFLLIVHAMDYRDNVIPYYIIIAACSFLSASMIILRGVYRRHFINILECFFVLNLIALFQINTYKGGSATWKSILSHLLVSLAFLVFLGIIAYHVYLKLSYLGLLRRFQNRAQNAYVDYDRLGCEGLRGYEPVPVEDHDGNPEHRELASPTL